MGALSAVETVLGGVGIGLGGGSISVRVGDLSGLAVAAGPETVDLVDDAGGEKGRQDVATGEGLASVREAGARAGAWTNLYS